MTEKEKEYNNKYLLMKHLLLSLEDMNKMNDHEINIMVNLLNTKLKN
jgi:hypothetical protein